MIGAFTTATGIPSQPYDLSGHLNIRGDGYQFREMRGTVGSSNISVDGLLTTRSGLSGTRFEFDFEGPAFHELVEKVGDLEVQPGPYQLSGNVLLDSDMVTLEGIELDRPAGDVKLELKLGLPVEREWMEFDVSARGRDVRSVIGRLDRFKAYEQPFSVEVRGSRNGAHWNFGKFDVGIGDATITAAGDLEFEEANASTEFSFTLSVPNLATLGEVDGRRFNDQGMSIVAHVTGGGGVLSFDRLDARIGESDISGEVRLHKGDVPSLEINVFSDSMIYAPLLKPGESEYEPEPEFKDGKLIPDLAIPFDEMTKMNVSLDIDIKELKRDTLLMRNVELSAALDNGALEITNASFKAKSGALVARGILEPVGDSGAASIELVARQFAPGILGLNADLAMTGDLDIKLQSTGADVRTLLGNTNGVLFVNTRGGRITDSKFIQALYGDLLEELINTVNPFHKTDPYTEFNCIVVPLQFEDGQVTSTPNLFMSTTKVRMVSAASIDLESEKLGISIRTTPTRTLGISAAELVNPYVQVVGTLGKPRLAVDEKGVLLSGGAAVATGGLSILARGLWDRMSRSKNPCKQTADGAIEQLGDRFPQLTLEGLGRVE